MKLSLFVISFTILCLISNIRSTPTPSNLFIFDFNPFIIYNVDPINGKLSLFYNLTLNSTTDYSSYQSVFYMNSSTVLGLTNYIINQTVYPQFTTLNLDENTVRFEPIENPSKYITGLRFNNNTNLFIALNQNNNETFINSYDPFTLQQTNDVNIQLPDIFNHVLQYGQVNSSLNVENNLYYLYYYYPTYPNGTWCVYCTYIVTYDLNTGELLNSIRFFFYGWGIQLLGSVSETEIICTNYIYSSTDFCVLNPKTGEFKNSNRISLFDIHSIALDPINQIAYAFYNPYNQLAFFYLDFKNDESSDYRWNPDGVGFLLATSQ